MSGRPFVTAEEQALVRDLCAVDARLSPWEVEFAESIANQLEDNRSLSPKQRETAERILRRLGK